MQPQNDRIIRALLQQPVDRRPIWLMRQAGRYLPEYRELRKRVPDFLSFCKTPELACEATLQPLSRFALDAAIVFSDILTIPDALGLDLQFVSGKGPVINDPIRSLNDVERLHAIDVEDALGYVMETIQLITAEIGDQTPVIGFAGSPWTVACYMVEGQGSKLFPAIRRMAYEAPDVMHALLKRLADVTVKYLNAQITAGARVVMLFDTWGGILGHHEYPEFSLAYMQMIAEQLIREVDGVKIPVVFFTKNASPWLSQIADSACDAVGIDSTIEMAVAKQRVGNRVALQGNIDPFLLFTKKPEKIQQAVIDILDGFGEGPGLVFNLGHGIDKNTPIENVSLLVESVHQYGRHVIPAMDSNS
ncbi:MAG: uroporphyrinogen decarboxylase [Coxiellaceae bacterium]|nr:uroporphyrinogen decarboxylase [Coxiellaceae bacterium]